MDAKDLHKEIFEAIRRFERRCPGVRVSCQLTYTSGYNIVSATRLNDTGKKFIPGIYKAYEEGIKGFKRSVDGKLYSRRAM